MNTLLGERGYNQLLPQYKAKSVVVIPVESEKLLKVETLPEGNIICKNKSGTERHGG